MRSRCPTLLGGQEGQMSMPAAPDNIEVLGQIGYRGNAEPGCRERGGTDWTQQGESQSRTLVRGRVWGQGRGLRQGGKVLDLSVGRPHLGNRTQRVLARLPAGEPIFPKVAQSIGDSNDQRLGKHWGGGVSHSVVPGTPWHPGSHPRLADGKSPRKLLAEAPGAFRWSQPGNHSL